ncbi:hypothetical protein GGR54DRAFT_334844 [Hypoxylon sp. NC1633]|nr:hypothetical protein GGR54DRAFT_334844 [Hypoxylon sp. NC1633]
MDPVQHQQERHARAWILIRVVLTSLSIISCIIVLGTSIRLATDPAIQSYIAVWTAPQAGVALLWSAAELITRYVSSEDRRGIHPGALVAVHLLLWLSFGAGVGLTAYILAFGLAFVNSDDRNKYPEYYDYYYNGSGNDYFSKYYIHSMEALVAFLAILIIIHLVLFAGACVETANYGRVGSKLMVSPPPDLLGYPMEQLEGVQLSRKDVAKKA